ncbi:MAG: hypothetical protein AWM53_01508 [Candidatus Dichloromethanomonas elyunquensis]|nr:MAG: hypothetical protein AWM53_01508 [Candidatus Dichloromethanomonas elyunquensis]
MQYEILGGSMPVVVCKLSPGESLFTESGGMGWMSSNISMSTNMEGGLLGGLTRKFSGESLFMTTYTCGNGEGVISFPASFPGSIIPFDLQSGESIIAQKKAFLCAEKSVQLEIHFKQKMGAGLFGGEGFIMQRITGPGKTFLEIDGSTIQHNLQPGEVMVVDTGHVAAHGSNVQMEVRMAKGFKNVLFGGEGLFLTELRGPGPVWLQTMPAMNLAKTIIPFLPVQRSSN